LEKKGEKMTMVRLVLSAMFTVWAVGFTACGDDEDNGKNGNGGGDPFANWNCEAPETTSCDYSACAMKSTYDQVATGDCASNQGYCDAVTDCYMTYIECFTDSCPPGETLGQDDATALSQCTTAVGTCVADASAVSTDDDTTDNGTTDNGNDDPFQEWNCSITDSNSCDYGACSMKSAYDQLMGQDCSTMPDACDAVEDCYSTYMDCFSVSCPPGDTVEDVDITPLSTCASNANTCITNATSAQAK
jgi:hypothetical protein